MIVSYFDRQGKDVEFDQWLDSRLSIKPVLRHFFGTTDVCTFFVGLRHDSGAEVHWRTIVRKCQGDTFTTVLAYLHGQSSMAYLKQFHLGIVQEVGIPLGRKTT